MNTMHSSRFSEDGVITVVARREIQSDHWSLTHFSPSWISLIGILLGAVALPPAEKGNSKYGLWDPIGLHGALAAAAEACACP